MQPVDLPAHLDDPKFFLIFTMEDVTLLIIAMAIGLPLHIMGWTLLAGFVLSFISSRFRGAVPEGRLYHILYFYGMSLGRGHSMINPLAKRFVG
jgi:conjugal transfer pilus assembly protein TraL